MNFDKNNINVCGKATVKNIFLSPRKANQVLSLIRGKDIDTALVQLHRCPRIAATYISKLLNSAVANSNGVNSENDGTLYIVEATVGRGTVAKRVHFCGRGKTAMRTKFLCCMKIVLGINTEEKNGTKS